MHAETNQHNWLYAPHNRYGFQHVQAFVPTMRVSRGCDPCEPMPLQTENLDHLSFSARTPSENKPTSVTFREALGITHTDAILIMHTGRIVMEYYDHGMRPDTLHLLMSCTKSYVGVMVGILADAGTIDLDATIDHYLPELGETGFAGGTIQQHLDMSVGTKFIEDYTDPNADINMMDFAVGWRPAPAGYEGPDTLQSLVASINERAYAHGAHFDYRSPISDVLGMLLERVSEKSLAELLRDLLWEPMGCEWDACITVDRERQALANGGLCTTLRDFARFGRLMVQNGFAQGRQIIPEAWIRDCRHGDDTCFNAWTASTFVQRAPNGHYRNQWWCRDRDKGVLLASGIHGQSLYIDPTVNVVIAKFSSQPEARDEMTFNLQFKLFEAVADHFS